ncbi:MAG: hypothetical protein HXY44_17235 [Syntrophaceae bacterium]|nr:hypothetical protein [Syntrophaceae bacterium]
MGLHQHGGKCLWKKENVAPEKIGGQEKTVDSSTILIIRDLKGGVDGTEDPKRKDEDPINMGT